MTIPEMTVLTYYDPNDAQTHLTIWEQKEEKQGDESSGVLWPWRCEG